MATRLIAGNTGIGSGAHREASHGLDLGKKGYDRLRIVAALVRRLNVLMHGDCVEAHDPGLHGKAGNRGRWNVADLNRVNLFRGFHLLEAVEIGAGVKRGAAHETQSLVANLFAPLGIAPNGASIYASRLCDFVSERSSGQLVT